MEIVDKIENILNTELKNKEFKHRNFLKLLKSEINAESVRKNKKISNEEQIKILEKMLKDNTETIRCGEKMMGNMEYMLKIKQENLILTCLLPTKASIEQIRINLEPIKEEIISSKNVGIAVGKSINYLNSRNDNISYPGDLVKIVVSEWKNV